MDAKRFARDVEGPMEKCGADGAPGLNRDRATDASMRRDRGQLLVGRIPTHGAVASRLQSGVLTRDAVTFQRLCRHFLHNCIWHLAGAP